MAMALRSRMINGENRAKVAKIRVGMLSCLKLILWEYPTFAKLRCKQ